MIGDVFSKLGQDVDAYGLFLQTIPYRFYSVLLLVFVWTVARTGRDFGPMAVAEQRAVSTGEVVRTGSSAPPAMDEIPGDIHRRGLIVNAVVPLASLVGGLVGGLAILGSDAVLWVMLWASLLASLSSL